MNLDLNLNLSQQQKLVMNQNMQLSIKILQMNSCDLREYINQQLEENPTLEISNEEKREEVFESYLRKNENDYNFKEYNPDNNVSPLDFISEKKLLKEFLYEQLCESKKYRNKEDLVKYLIENLDGKGYLDESIDSIAMKLDISVDEVEEGLNILQNFEPFGIGARSLEECLLIQVYKKGIYNNYVEDIIVNYLELIANNKFTEIAKKLKITAKEAQNYGDIIKKLEPKPSRGYYTGEETNFIVPDAFIKKIDGEYFILMNNDIIPSLHINEIYKEALKTSEDKEV